MPILWRSCSVRELKVTVYSGKNQIIFKKVKIFLLYAALWRTAPIPLSPEIVTKTIPMRSLTYCSRSKNINSFQPPGVG